MSPYPGEKSVLVMDNASIHHHHELIDLVESGGAWVIFLPPYSPDFTPIEEAFSAIYKGLVASKQRICHVLSEFCKCTRVCMSYY